MSNYILRLGFTDTFDSVKNFFTQILSEKFKIIRDDVSPDYLIFGDRNFGSENEKFNNKKCIKIFYTGENERPWNYTCQYAISFDHSELDGKNYRLPLYVLYDYDNRFRNVPNIENVVRSHTDLVEKERNKFCSFVVKNGSCEIRNRWFFILNDYCGVSSAGPHLNNIGHVLSRGKDSVEAKHKFLNMFKFNLCFENSSYPGYVTEKLYEALTAKTIPIYWGSPTVGLDFNPNAFLNWHEYGNDHDFLNAIKEVNENMHLYEKMYLEPMFLNSKKNNKFFNRDRFLNWFEKNVYKGTLNE